jgi:hypothetical protein
LHRGDAPGVADGSGPYGSTELVRVESQHLDRGFFIVVGVAVGSADES